MPAEDLEQTAAIKILLYLFSAAQETKMTDLVRGIKASQNAIYRAIAALKTLELLRDEVTSYPLKRIFMLTNKGRLVAEKLQEIEDILKS